MHSDLAFGQLPEFPQGYNLAINTNHSCHPEFTHTQSFSNGNSMGYGVREIKS